MNTITKAFSIASIVLGVSCATVSPLTEANLQPSVTSTAADARSEAELNAGESELMCFMNRVEFTLADSRVLRDCKYSLETNSIPDEEACRRSAEYFQTIKRMYDDCSKSK